MFPNFVQPSPMKLRYATDREKDDSLVRSWKSFSDKELLKASFNVSFKVTLKLIGKSEENLHCGRLYLEI